MPVIVLDSVITHTSTWFLDKEIHQLVFSGLIGITFKESVQHLPLKQPRLFLST